ncbi:MAG: hypothetical protein QW502_03410, partial [Candidatus Bathyarchaeia archaeon]
TDNNPKLVKDKPATMPPLKALKKALKEPSFAASAVLEFMFTVINVPVYAEMVEKADPKRKDIAFHIPKNMSRITAKTALKSRTNRNCLFR